MRAVVPTGGPHPLWPSCTSSSDALAGLAVARPGSSGREEARINIINYEYGRERQSASPVQLYC